ncbi:hypothetical protein PR048_006691 [Dryococelus australis]|uniref:E3 SUMO-protein ligase NSE2 n=1 Tax=Dryococelus australis TaxID=614101 RepID=A0ABQ9ICN2_9NEOP|nr:hypothetical protein PR048_006691 [Dryococelus australis]
MSQNDEISRLILTSKNTLASSAKLIARLMEGSERKGHLQEFERILGDLCKLGEEHKNVCVAMEEVKKACKRPARRSRGEDENANVDCPEAPTENPQAMYRAKLKALQGVTPDVSLHPDMMAFKTMLREVLCYDYGADDDEDVVLTAAEINIHDPFTRRVIVDPVKNIKCGHSYDRETIEEMLKKGSIKCPYLSCPNRTEVRLVDLEPDKKLMKHLETQRATVDSTSSDVAELDDSELL